MTDSPITVLLIEDNPADARLIREMLAEPAGAGQAAPFRLIHAGRLADGLAALAQAAADVVLLDLSLPDSQGLDTFLRVRAAAPETAVVVLTGLENEQTALKAIQAGAQDYLVKGQVDSNVLGRAVRYAIERKRAEAALRESEEKYRLLIENSHDIIYTLTADGVFTFVSPAWTVLLGHPVTQVAGQPFQPFVHPDDLAGCMAWLQKVIETGQRQEGVEYRVRHIDGSWYWHTSSAVPLRDETGTIVGFEGTARDITAQKQAENALRELNATLEQRVAERTAELRAASERLITLERLKSQFLANASHELRTPLANIKTSLYLLERGKPEKREKYMTTLNNETALLQSLLEDLLDAAALDFGRAQPALVPVDLGLLLAKLVETRVALVAERNLRLELAADPTTPLMLADAKMLRQAIKALLLDTADHEAAGGRIALYTQPFAAAGRAWGALTVGGDAPAPTPDEQASLFALAKAAEGPQADQPPDTNLRLAVCREIIIRHGGRMAVQPRAGRSSIVTLWLPAA